MNTVLASAASNQLEALIRRVYASVLGFSFIEVVANQFLQRQYFGVGSDIALGALGIAVIGVIVSAWGRKARNNLWLWAFAVLSFAAVILLPLLQVAEFPVVDVFEPWVWWSVGLAALSAGITGDRLGFMVFVPLISLAWMLTHVYLIGGPQAWANGLKDGLYVFFLAGGVSGLIALVRDWAKKVDVENSNLILSHMEKAKSDALEKEDNLIDSLIHDSVLHTFLAAANAKSKEEGLIASQLAGFSVTKFKNLENDNHQDGSVTVLGLLRALRKAVMAMGRGVEVELKAGGLDRVTIEVGQALTEAALQAVDNALVHSKANKILVTLDSQIDSEIEIQVVDNGVGFKPNRIPADRLGIKISILSKMELIGGKAEVISSARSGTTVKLRWPK